MMRVRRERDRGKSSNGDGGRHKMARCSDASKCGVFGLFKRFHFRLPHSTPSLLKIHLAAAFTDSPATNSRNQTHAWTSYNVECERKSYKQAAVSL